MSFWKRVAAGVGMAVGCMLAVRADRAPVVVADSGFETNRLETPIVFTGHYDWYAQDVHVFAFSVPSNVYLRLSVDPAEGDFVRAAAQLDVARASTDFPGEWDAVDSRAFPAHGLAEPFRVPFYSNVAYRVSLRFADVGAACDYRLGFGLESVQVKFNPGGGTLAASEAKKDYTVGFPYASLPTPEREADFLGWYAPDGTCVNAQTLAVAEVTCVTARWTNVAYDYPLVYHAAFGEDAVVTQMCHSTTPVTCLAGTDLWTRVGYTLDGWAETWGGSRVYAFGQVVDKPFVAAEGESKDLYAVWQAQTYSVSFQGHADSGVMTNEVHAYDECWKVPSNAFVRIGCDFAGWRTNDAEDVVFHTGDVVSNLTVVAAETVVFQAQWRGFPYQVVCDPNGAEGAPVTNDFAYSFPQTVTNLFEREGYSFLGWSTNSAPESEIVYTNGASVSFAEVTTNDIVTLYAQWEHLSYTVAFQAGGGSGTMTNLLYELDRGYRLPTNVFTRVGYVFDFWTNAVEACTYENGAWVTNVSRVAASTGTLTACWSPIRYAVYFDENGAQGNVPGYLDCVYDTVFSLPEPTELTPTNASHFVGWSTVYYGHDTMPTGVESVSNLTAQADDVVTLYAVWRPNDYTVVFHANTNAVAGADAYAQAFVVGTAARLGENRFVVPGAKFKGWHTNDVLPVKKGKTVAYYKPGQDPATIWGDSIAQGAERHLYAFWEQDAATDVHVVDPAYGGVTTNLSVALRETGETAIYGVLSNVTGCVTQRFTVVGKGLEQSVRLSIDPGMGDRVGARVQVRDAANGILAEASDLDVASTNVTLKGDQEYTFIVSVDPAALDAAGVDSYAYVVGLGREGVSVTYDVRDAPGYAREDDLETSGTNFVFTVGTPYGYPLWPETPGAYTNATFAGWFTQTNRSQGVAVSRQELVSSNVVLQACWDLPPYDYKIVFDGNGGEGSMAAMEVGSDEVFALPASGFSRESCKFLGWDEAKKGLGTKPRYRAGQQIVSALASGGGQTVTLYAVWTDRRPASHYTDGNGVTWCYVPGMNQTAKLANWVPAGDDETETEGGTMRPVISPSLAGALTIPSYVVENGTNYVVTMIDECAFDGCSGMTQVTIPASVSLLGSYAFRNCTALARVTFGSDTMIEDIPEGCFAGCSALTTLEMPYSVRTIDDYAFADCTSLGPGITIPEHVDTLGAYVFTNCPNLKIVRYLGNEPSDVDEDVYAGTKRALMSGILSRRAEDGWDIDLPGYWNSRTAMVWKTTSASLARVKFDPNGGAGSVSGDWQIKGHSLLELPEDPEWEKEEEGNYSVTHAFLGWYSKKTGGNEVTAATKVTGAATYYAHWDTIVSLSDSQSYKFDNLPDPSVMGFDDETYPFAGTRAYEYNGFLLNAEYLTSTPHMLLGSIQVKVAAGKLVNGVTNYAVTAVITRDGVATSYQGTMKCISDQSYQVVEVVPVKGYDTASYVLRFNDLAMTGCDVASTEGSDASVFIWGSRNALSESKSPYEDFDMKKALERFYLGDWSCTCPFGDDTEEEAYSQKGRLFLNVGTGGKVKVSGMLSDEDTGTFSATVQLVAAYDRAYVPICVDFKNGATLRVLLEIPGGTGTEDEDSDPDTELALGADTVGVYQDKTLTRYVCRALDAEDVLLTFDPTGEESQLQMVGVAYSVPVHLAEDVEKDVKYSATGLPSGLKIDAKTGLVSGVPTKAGSFVASVKATIGKGSATVTAAVRAVFDVQELPTWAQGTFVGWVASDADLEPAGYVTMTVSKVGKISGKVQTQGTNWTFSANAYDVTSSEDALQVVAQAKSGKAVRDVRLEMNDSEIMGFFGLYLEEDDDEYWEDESSVTLYRQPDWKTFKLDEEEEPLIAGYVGYYTSVLTADDTGYGYLTFTVAKTGSVKYTGKLPDGTALSGSTVLAYDGSDAKALIYATPSAYKKGGCVCLEVLCTAADEISVATVESAQDGTWISMAPNATGVYGNGFEQTLTLEGSWYDTKANLDVYYYTKLAFAADSALALDVPNAAGDSVSAQDLECWDDLTISLNAKGSAFIVDQKKTTPTKNDSDEYDYSGENDAALTFSFTKATGIFKGSFLAWFDYYKDKDSERLTHTSKKVSFEGVAVQGAEGTSAMKGFYLWSRTGAYEDEKGKEKTFTYKESHAVTFE